MGELEEGWVNWRKEMDELEERHMGRRDWCNEGEMGRNKGVLTEGDMDGLVEQCMDWRRN